MNVQAMRLRLHNLNQDFQAIWKKFRASIADEESHTEHVMSEEELIDESLEESFPASDSPAHFSKSSEDRPLH